MLVFPSGIENIVVLVHIFVVFAHALVAFTQNSKEPSSGEEFQQLSSQSERAHYCSHKIKSYF